MREGEIIEGGFWDGAEVLSVYTRAQAIEDGVLADVSERARECGFVVPVAVTSAVWALIEPTGAEVEQGAQDTDGRLWDVLWMSFLAIKRGSTGGALLYAPVIFFMWGREGFRNGQQQVKLKLVSGPGDEGEHVITIMLPDED